MYHYFWCRGGLRGFNGVMLTEEALILLATLGASGLLVLGVAELAWPTKPRTQPRRTRPTVPPPRPESPAVTPATTLTDIEPVRPAEEHEPFAEPSVAAMRDDAVGARLEGDVAGAVGRAVVDDDDGDL